jgi:hypothetical protein
MERVQRREVLVHRVARLFTIGSGQRRFIENLNDANTGAFELVLTPLIHAGIGVWVGNAVGGGVLLPLVFGFVGFFGVTYRLIAQYKVRMKKAEEGKPWAKQ